MVGTFQFRRIPVFTHVWEWDISPYSDNETSFDFGRSLYCVELGFVPGNNDFLSHEAIQFLAGLQVGPTLTQIDLSFSRLDLDLRPLDQITCLEILILDNCSLTDQHQLPAISSLRTLRYPKPDQIAINTKEKFRRT